MVDVFEAIKASVREHRKQHPSLPLGYAVHLELAVRLATGAQSLNHFSAKQDSYSIGPVPTVREILASLQACEHLVANVRIKVPNPGQPDDYQRYERWQFMAEIWGRIVVPQLGDLADPLPLHNLLARASDIEELRIPQMVSDGKILSCSDSALEAPDETWILSAWLFEKEGLGIQHWERLRQVAFDFGYGDRAADYYRSACRESVNHTWHPSSAVALGVYDVLEGTPGFFRAGESDEEFRNRIERIWKFEEPEAFE